MPEGADHKQLFDHMPVPRILVRPDGDGFVIVTLNLKAQEFFWQTRK